MKNNTLPEALRRILLPSFLLAGTIATLFAFKAGEEQADAALKMIGISKLSGSQKIKTSLLNGYLDYYGLQPARKIAVGDRAGITKDLLLFTKTYVGSESFAAAYSETKAAAKPQLPKPARSSEQIRDEYIKTTKEGIASSEKAMASMPAEYHKAMQEGIDALKKQLEEYQRPDSELMKILAQGEQQQYEWGMKEYQTKLADWEKNYPANQQLFVKQQLQKMLEKIKGVDYNAALRDDHGLKRFVNPAYEAKPDEWKLAFRAGKEVTETVIPFVQQWVAEIK
jgi:hypothetical protein